MEERWPLHGTTQWEYDDLYVGPDAGKCRYCDEPVRKEQVVCARHKGYYMNLRRKVKRQVARLLELARERQAESLSQMGQ